MLILNVNGQLHSVTAPPDTPLLYVLRNELQLNSPRFGCGLCQCGSCMVHVDGAPVLSCVTPVASVIGRQVLTLEGLGTLENPHPLQRAFIEEQASQCGYCIPGIIMSAKALLDRNPQPSDREIRAWLSWNPCCCCSNLCRCGTHASILRAIKRAAAEMAGLAG